jgi:hypothetical protein
VSEYRQGASVYDAVKPSAQAEGLQQKTKHLSAIHALPESCWQSAVERLTVASLVAYSVASAWAVLASC